MGHGGSSAILECLVGSGKDEEELCIYENNLTKSLKAHSIYHQLFEQDLYNQFLSSMTFFNTVYIPQSHPLRWYHLVVGLAPWKEALYLIHFSPPRAFITQKMFYMFGENKSEWKDNHWHLFNYTQYTHTYMYVCICIIFATTLQLCELGTTILMLITFNLDFNNIKI